VCFHVSSLVFGLPLHLYVKTNLSWYVVAPCHHGSRVSLYVGNNKTSLKMCGEMSMFIRNRYTQEISRIYFEPHVTYILINTLRNVPGYHGQ
jgi:hypothetical protein